MILTKIRLQLPVFFCVGVLLSILSFQLRAQSNGLQNLKITYSSNNQPAIEILENLERSYELEFRYRYAWIQDLNLSINATDVGLETFLKKLFEGSNITFLFKDPNYIVLLKKSPTSFSLNTKNANDNSGLIVLGTPDLYQSYDSVVLSGVVSSGETGETLPGVTVQALETNVNDVTNVDGSYSIFVPVGYHTVKFQSVASGEITLSMLINAPANFDLELYPNVIQLGDLVIRAQREDANISETITGIERITAKDIKSLPALLGEADVVRSITSLPGVSATGEASVGFNVRGSGPAGNLVLVDNATLFNTSHLFGLFTAFSPNAVESVDLYKGTIPAKFGGRISSVLDVKFKDGDKEKVTGSGGAGIVSSRFNIEAPIIKGKSSILASTRLAYPNWILRSIRNNDLQNSRTFFGDLTLKYDHVINKKNRFSGTFYASDDDFTLGGQADFNYSNRAGSLQWKRIISKNLSSEFSLNSSHYVYGLSDISDLSNRFSMDASVRKNDFKADLTYAGLEGHVIDFGVQSTFYDLQPGDFSAESGILEIEDLEDLNPDEGLENAVYVGDAFNLTEDLSAYAGLRFTVFSDLDGTNFYGLEPRVSLNYKIDESSSLKAGYNRTRQNIHLITNTVAVSPVDLWQLSSSSISPVIADQYSLGVFKNFQSNIIEASVEGFYRDIDNFIEFRNGANLLGNPQVSEELVQGEGRSYGVEFYLKKNRGKLTGWVSYTFSRSFGRVDLANSAESINDGELFPTNIDQPHNLNLFANLNTSRRFDISFNFVYATGRPFTSPTSAFDFAGVSVLNFDTRNNERIPDFHRLDLSFHLGTTLKKKKGLEADWTLTLFNVYSRRNVFSAFFQTSPNGMRNEAFTLSVIGQIVPALTYNFRF